MLTSNIGTKTLAASFTAAVLLFSPFSTVNAQPELKGSPEQLRQFLHPREDIVTLNGDAEKKAYSDSAILTLVVTTDKKKLADSIARNGKLRSDITQQLGKQGINQKNIKNAKFSSTPEYGWFGDEPDSYKISNRMAVTIANEKQLKAVAAIADKYKEAELSTTEFKHTKKEAFKTQVKEMALAKIMKLKAMYEKNLGVKLTAKNFRDNHIGFQPTHAAMMMRDEMVRSRPKAKALSSVAYESAPKAAPTSFDEVVYRANISVDFVVSNK